MQYIFRQCRSLPASITAQLHDTLPVHAYCRQHGHSRQSCHHVIMYDIPNNPVTPFHSILKSRSHSSSQAGEGARHGFCELERTCAGHRARGFTTHVCANLSTAPSHWSASPAQLCRPKAKNVFRKTVRLTSFWLRPDNGPYRNPRYVFLPRTAELYCLLSHLYCFPSHLFRLPSHLYCLPPPHHTSTVSSQLMIFIDLSVAHAFFSFPTPSMVNLSSISILSSCSLDSCRDSRTASVTQPR